MHKRLEWSIKFIFFIALLLCVPMHTYAYFGKNEDYKLSTEKPEDKSPKNYFEFVSEETYTVKCGDTLWKIAESYFGDGADYQYIVSDNRDVISMPELLIPGTELKLRKTLYTNVGFVDFIDSDVFRSDGFVDGKIFRMESFSPPYRILTGLPYVNDLQDADPYTNWEEFQREVSECSKKVCKDRVSDLSFERYWVSWVGPLCGYNFTFDAGDKEYIVMAYFCYNNTTKSEAFAVCDKKLCTEEQFKEAKGKVFYAAVRNLDPGAYIAKTRDYVGAEDWNYPQLRNPFTDAMHSLYTGPLSQVEDYPDDYVIKWKEPALEKLVREELAALWQLTPEEKQAFMERDMTAGDLSKIEELAISYFPLNNGTEEFLRVQLNGCQENGDWGANVSAECTETSKLLSTLEDLRNFHELRNLKLTLRDSDITDLSCIEKLVNLRILECDIYSNEVQIENIDFLGSLVNLRTLCLGGWSKGRITKFFEGVTDLSILGRCPRLAYLTLHTGNVENYDFLGELPEIYYIRLDSGWNCKDIIPDESLLPNACFIEFYGESVRFEIGEGYNRPWMYEDERTWIIRKR